MDSISKSQLKGLAEWSGAKHFAPQSGYGRSFAASAVSRRLIGPEDIWWFWTFQGTKRVWVGVLVSRACNLAWWKPRGTKHSTFTKDGKWVFHHLIDREFAATLNPQMELFPEIRESL